jgi:hypothetical protein
MSTLKIVTGAALAFTALSLGCPRTSHADEVSTTGKGIAGCSLLGGEVVLLGESAFGVKPTWAYVLGGSVGAIGGGVGGYFVEKGGDAKLTMYLLTGGMALLIPTTIVVLNATSYEAPKDVVEDRPKADEPAAEPPAAPPQAPSIGPSTPTTTPPTSAPPAGSSSMMPPALIGVGQGTLSLSLPALEVSQVFSPEEVSMFGVEQHASFRVPVFNMVF